MEQLLDWNGAAVYCGVPLTYLRSQIRNGHGPIFIQPSPRRTYFSRVDLDNWIESWKRIRREPQHPATH